METETKRSDLEEEYLSKITKIWNRKNPTITAKIKMSMEVVNNVDWIEWPKKAPKILSELAGKSLKEVLLQSIGDNIKRAILSPITETSVQNFFWRSRN